MSRSSKSANICWLTSKPSWSHSKTTCGLLLWMASREAGLTGTLTRGAEILGSPLVMLGAAREAEARINLDRQKPFKIDAQYYFIDQDSAPRRPAKLPHRGPPEIPPPLI